MAEKALKVRVISPEQTLFQDSADAVFVPGSVSPFEVLPGHAPIISSLASGNLIIRTLDGEMHTFAVVNGIIRVKDNEVVVCVG